MPLLLHADPAVIDTVYTLAPELTVAWAHAGTFPDPGLVVDYLGRYPGLHIDLSVRDDWSELMVNFPERVLVGVDTFSTARWISYLRHAARIRRRCRHCLRVWPSASPQITRSESTKSVINP